MKKEDKIKEYNKGRHEFIKMVTTLFDNGLIDTKTKDETMLRIAAYHVSKLEQLDKYIEP